MGNLFACCETVPDAPKEIIPDPSEHEACTISIAKNGMLSNDYIAYKGAAAEIDDNKWFYINKEGRLFTGDCQIFLENFKRGGNPEKPKQGEVLWTVKFDESPNFDRQFKSPQEQDWFGWSSGWGDFDGQDDGDDFYFDEAANQLCLNSGDQEFRRIMQWKMTTRAEILGGTRADSRFQLEVFVRGTSVCFYNKNDMLLQEEGEEVKEEKWLLSSIDFVDKLCYRILKDGSQIAGWAIEGKDWGDRSDQEFPVETPMFSMQLKGGWLQPTPIMQTNTDFDPTLGLIVAYMCTYEFSPSAVKFDLDPKFPETPFGWGAGGW